MTTSATSEDQALRQGWRKALTTEEVRALLTMRDYRSWFTVAFNWGVIAAAFAMVAAWPNPLTVILALFLLGGRMLGLAILMHDASHRALFAGRRVNDWVGNWLCAYPVWSDLHPYRPYHLQHHGKTGLPEDPDIGLVRPFPISRSSLRRKIWRDLNGKTGSKFAIAAAQRTFGRFFTDSEARWAAIGFATTNLALLGILTLCGYPLLYLLWVIAWLTTYTLVTRIRSIAEHALTPDPNDPLGNTRTTIATPLERLFLAPNRVNYHLEHHLLMTVPHYNLPRMHALLGERGILDQACVERGYWKILARASSKGSMNSEGLEEGDANFSSVNGLLSPPEEKTAEQNDSSPENRN